MLYEKKGFTFIELLVVVAIIALTTGILSANFLDFGTIQKLKTESDKVVEVLELAKKRALASELPSSSCDFQGYKVVLNAQNYIMRVCCSEACPARSDDLTYLFSSGISITNPGSVTFFSLLKKVTAQTSPFVISSQTGSTVLVIVTDAGLVEKTGK